MMCSDKPNTLGVNILKCTHLIVTGGFCTYKLIIIPSLELTIYMCRLRIYILFCHYMHLYDLSFAKLGCLTPVFMPYIPDCSARA